MTDPERVLKFSHLRRQSSLHSPINLNDLVDVLKSVKMDASQFLQTHAEVCHSDTNIRAEGCFPSTSESLQRIRDVKKDVESRTSVLLGQVLDPSLLESLRGHQQNGYSITCLIQWISSLNTTSRDLSTDTGGVLGRRLQL